MRGGMAGTLFIVATPIGNLEDITARALRVLGDVALIAAEDTRRTAHLLARYAIKTPSTSLHEHNETKKTASLIARLQRGDSVALVSDAGTPGISDPGQRLIRDAIAAGIRVEAIPGPNAAVTALAALETVQDDEWQKGARVFNQDITVESTFRSIPEHFKEHESDIKKGLGRA